MGERDSWKRYADRNRASRREWHKRHYRRNASKVAARIMAYRKTPAGKRAQRTHDLRQRIKFPERHAARQAVHIAIMNGTIVRRPCERCGDPKSHAHHHDYSRPLDIKWLCSRHHAEEHRKIGFVIEDGALKTQPVLEAAE